MEIEYTGGIVGAYETRPGPMLVAGVLAVFFAIEIVRIFDFDMDVQNLTAHAINLLVASVVGTAFGIAIILKSEGKESW